MAAEGRWLIDLYAASRLVADGQKRIATLLGGMLEAGKLSPSLIFTGPEGSGKQLMSLWLGARLNCESRVAKAEPGLGLEIEPVGPAGGKGNVPEHAPGDRCAACEKASKLEHPDLHIIFPMPSGPPEKSLPVIIESRREDFLAEREFSGKARSIGIDQIRAVIEEVSKHPFEGRHSVVMIFEAHLATIEAQNSFLKLLEEPPGSAMFVLVTEYPDRLLPTIRSRGQEIRFDLLPEGAVASFLETFYSVEPGEAARLAGISGGNLRRAVRLLDSRFLGIREDASSALRLVLEGKTRQLPAEAEALAREYAREETGSLLAEMISLLRELMLLREAPGDPGEEGGQGETIRAQLGEEALEAAANRNIPADIRKVETAARNLARNVDIELTLAQLLLDLAGKWY